MFLFVVMLLDISQTEILAHQRGAYPVAGILGICLILAVQLCFYGPVQSNNMHTPFFMDTQKSVFLPDWNVLNTSMSSVVQLGIQLYGVHVDLLLLASLLLLIQMVGAVQLTLKRRAAAPVHDVFVQHSVDFQKVVYMLKK